MDAYVSRCMKNWAAFKQPLQNGRERLLRSASIRPDLYRTRLGSPLAGVLRSRFFTQTLVEPEGEWLLYPFTPSRLWSFNNLTTSPRLTTI